MAVAIISTEGLSHCYNEGKENALLALRDIGLSILPGEFVAIVGANGSGKSTLAKHFNALLLPTEGRVLVNGLDTADPDNVWEVRRTAGMVFQNPDNQLVATVVEEDVAFGPENLGVPPAEIRQRVERALATVGMDGMARREPHLLSGGQKQRVAIAGILAMEPEVIVLDESTAMLDPLGRAEVLDTVGRLNAEKGITVVHITHHMDEATRADRVYVMAAGSIAFYGTPRQVFARVRELRQMGLDVPQAAELAERLRQAGLALPEGILSAAELVDALCHLWSKN